MLLTVSPHNPIPLYQQVVEQVRAKILAGELRPEDPLPSIRELARDLTTSVITTKRAYLELEKEGLLVIRPGLGTFVARVTPEKLQELKRARVREQLRAAVREARQVGLGPQELQEMLEDVLTEQTKNE